MPAIENTVWCYGCGVEILWAPWVVGKRTYCCLDCLEVGSCECGERMELEDERREAGVQTPAAAGEYGL